MKICPICKEEKTLDFFYKEINHYRNKCKQCYSIHRKQHRESESERLREVSRCNYQVNKEKIKERGRQYREKNKEKIAKSSKEYQKKYKTRIKQYKNDNKDKINEYSKNYILKRLKSDPIFKFSTNLRALIRQSFKRNGNKYEKKSKTENILGCTVKDFKNYITLKFSKGMSLNNHGEWHLDHIIPLATAKTEEEIIRLNHYTNFQPLWAKDNLIKGDKIIEQQLTLI